MSRIKDLLAVEEGIDDLMPVKNEAEMLADFTSGYITNHLADIEKELEECSDSMQIDFDGDDKGHLVGGTWENSYALCEILVQDIMEKLIEEQRFNVADDEFATILDIKTKQLEELLEEDNFASRMIKEYIGNIEENYDKVRFMYK